MDTSTHNHSLNTQNSKAWSLRYSDSSTALKIAEEVKNAAIETNLLEYHFAQLTIAQLIFWKSSSSEQFITVSEALHFFTTENNALGISRANLISASMHDQFGQYEKAMAHALNAVKTGELAGDELNKSDCYTLLGQVYSRINDYQKAILNLEKGLVIRNLLNDNKASASSLNLIARNYVLSKKYEEAFSFYNQSLELREKTNDVDGIPWTYLGLASLFLEKKEFHKSLEYYKKAESSNLKSEKRFELVCLIGISKVLLFLSEYNNAIACLTEALLIAETLHIVSLKSEAHELLSECYEKTNDLSKSLFHFKQYNLLRQEILSNDKVNTLKNQQIAFSVEHAEKEAEINRLKNVELKNAFDKIELQHHELEEKNKEITDSINYAKRIQSSYMASENELSNYLSDYFVIFKPKDIVSGDFYWANYHNDSFYLCTADSTGHGIPGAFMSLLNISLLNEALFSRNFHNPSDILNFVRKILIQGLKSDDCGQGGKDGMDCSLIRFDFTKNILSYSAANNPIWILRKTSVEELNTHDYELIELKPDKMPVGKHDKQDVSFSQHEFKLQKGDRVYTITDGFADQFGGPNGKKFMSKYLKELLQNNTHLPMLEQKQIVDTAFEKWKGNLEQVDDVCVIGLAI